MTDSRKRGTLARTVVHRQVKHLNTVIEVDHGKLKQLIKSVRGFRTLKTAYATIEGCEVMCTPRKRQARPWQQKQGNMGEVHLIEKQVDTYTF